MKKEDLIAKMLKVLALAERGVDGERVNARKLLDRMMRDHGISEDALDSNAPIDLTYMIDNDNERILLNVIISYALKITGNESWKMMGWRTDTSIKVHATMEQHGEIAALYEHYRIGLADSFRIESEEYQERLDFIKTKIKEIKKDYQKALEIWEGHRSDARKNHNSATKYMTSAFICRNGLMRYYKATGKISDKEVDRFDVAYDYAVRMDSPNQLPSQRLGGGDDL